MKITKTRVMLTALGLLAAGGLGRSCGSSSQQNTIPATTKPTTINSTLKTGSHTVIAAGTPRTASSQSTISPPKVSFNLTNPLTPVDAWSKNGANGNSLVVEATDNSATIKWSGHDSALVNLPISPSIQLCGDDSLTLSVTAKAKEWFLYGGKVFHIEWPEKPSSIGANVSTNRDQSGLPAQVYGGLDAIEGITGLNLWDPKVNMKSWWIAYPFNISLGSLSAEVTLPHTGEGCSTISYLQIKTILADGLELRIQAEINRSASVVNP